MDGLSELLGISTLDIVRWCVIAIIVIGALTAVGVKVYRVFKRELNKYSANEHITKERIEMLEKHEKSIAELQETDNEILRTLQEIQGSLQAMTDRQNHIELAGTKAEKNKLKDRIGQIYRCCHLEGKITKIQKTALLGLIENIEELGEHNSFVHETVQPEIETWEVIED